MEESQDKIPYDKKIRYAGMESAWDGKSQEKHIEGGRNAKLCADENNNKQTQLSICICQQFENV